MSDIQDIKERVSIAEVIGDHVRLTPAGTYLRGLCPFHHEKTPSFFVNDTLGFYKCFGCGESGDVYDFLQKYDSMTFSEALEYLAQKTGVKLSREKNDPQDKLRERVCEILAEAAKWYQKNLELPKYKKFADYLTKRGVRTETIKLFALGAAGSEWSELTDYLRSKKYTEAEMVASGMVKNAKTGRLYDAFRDRLMFPLRDHRGRVVGFSGRLLEEKEGEGKYINTPETIVYHKGKMLYGLHELNREIKKQDALLIVEGEFDMISSFQTGVDYVAAIKGSALTEEHAKLIARYAHKVILALDSDKAGIKATKKAILTLRPYEVELRVVMMKAGQDPDDAARSDGATWRQRVAEAVSGYDFFLDTILSQNEIGKIEGQKQAIKELASVFALIDSRLEYEHYLKKLAERMQEDKEVLRADLERWRDLGERNQQAASAKVAAIKPSVMKKKKTRLEKLEAYVWFLFLQSLAAENVGAEVNAYILKAEWETQFLRQLADYYREYASKNTKPTLKGWTAMLPADFTEKVKLLLFNRKFIDNPLKGEKLEAELKQQCATHRAERAKSKVIVVSARLRELDACENLTVEQEEERNELLRQVSTLKRAIIAA